VTEAVSAGKTSVGRRTKKFFAGLTGFTVALSGAIAFSSPAVAAGDVDGTVSGIVFQDFASSGWYTTGAPEVGQPRNRPVAGVTATAYDAQGDVVGTALSGTDGRYTVTVEDAFSADLRVEFSGWDATKYEPDFAAQGVAPPSMAGANETSVQFAQLGDTAVDFGLVIPDEVIQTNAPLSTVIQYAGRPGATGNTSNGLTAIASQPWSLTGSSDTPGHFNQRNSLATFAQVGSTWGMTYNRTRNIMIASAVLKRMSGLYQGPTSASDDLGAIFRMDDVLLGNGSHNPVATNSAERWFSVAGLPITNGGGTVDLGTIGSNTDRGLNLSSTPARDIDAFAKSARVGLGGIATSLDGGTLWVTNLNDHKVYAIDITDTDAVPTAAWQVPVPVSANQQIWALTLYQGRLYAGVVDTGTDAGRSASASGMNAYVYSIDANRALPGVYAVPSEWQSELTIPLGYTKGSNVNGTSLNTAVTTNVGGIAEQLTRWNAWADTWTWTAPSGASTSAGVGVLISGWTTGDDGRVQMYPQPILSSIAFDIDGYMTIGLADRTQLQGGNVNYPASTGDDNLWETVVSGDMLIAAPASGGGFTLESDGDVGTRTSTWPTNQRADGNGGTTGGGDNNQGVDGGEFFNDRRDLGRGDVHWENTLGSVATYPGVDQVASSAMDPLAGLYRSGLMWFDQNNGAAARGFDQVNGTGNDHTPEFQKGGGLGALALLGVAAPVEIGNRVWLDADLNGRQDSDEPGINGAIVQLWTVDENGDIKDLVGTRTTATVGGQPGTYYFRSDDTDIAFNPATSAKPSLVQNANYVLRFLPGTTPLTLVGPNADHAGFAGLEWDDLKLTTAEVRTAGSAAYSGATTAGNDSNPDVETGEYAIRVGGPAQNNHTYDAGYIATNTYDIEKIIDAPEGVEFEEGATFTVGVLSAVNFRGEDRLTAGGPDLVDGRPTGSLPVDPKVTEVTFTVGAGATVTADTELPLGYMLTFAETGDTTGATVTFTPPNGENATQGRLVVSPGTQSALRAKLQVENAYGGFTLQKAVTSEDPFPEGQSFTLSYSYTVGEDEVSEEVTITAGAAAVRPVTTPIPFGTEVTVCELAPAIPGWTWTGVTWAVGDNAVTPVDGCVTVTITAENPDLAFVATNAFDQITGGFSVTKVRAQGEPLADAEFSFQYMIGDDCVDAGALACTPVNLGPLAAGETASSVDTIIHGSTVWVREIAPADTANVSWADVVWSNTPEGWTAEADGWYSFTFLAPTAVALTATNKASEQFGAFQVTKRVVTTGDPDVDGRVFDLEYRTGSGDPVTWSAPVAFSLTADQASAVFGGLPLGMIVQVREAQPVNTPGVAWGVPSWTVGGASATIVGGWTQFTITAADINETVALEVTNAATETFGSFTLAKALDGTASGLVADLNFSVDVQIGDGDVQRIALAGDGTVWAAASDLPIGTVVKVKEVTPLPVVTGVSWGTPTWAAAAGTTLTTDDAGWTTFTIASENGAALTVTNYPTQQFGAFTVAKQLTVVGDPAVVPAGTEYEVEYQIGTAAPVAVTLNAGQTSALIGNLPFGTVVKVREGALPAVPGVVWGDPAWTIDGAAATPDADGWVSFTITTESTVAFVVTNTATQQYGQFQVVKTVAGDGAELVPNDAVFIFEYTVDGGPAQQLTVTTAEASAIIGGLPFGTEVTVSEIGFPVVPGTEWDAAPVWSIDGEPATAPLTFTIDGTTLVEVGAENTATRVFGSFELTKFVTGAAERIPDDASFTVEYSTDGGETWEVLPAITADARTIAGPDLLVGTTVLVREAAPAAGADFEWGTPVFVVDGVTQGATASFTIAEADQLVEIELTNEALPLDGMFQVTKRITGTGSSLVVGDPVFTVRFSYEGQSDTAELTVRAGQFATSEAIPAGTVVTIEEITPTGGLVEGASWGTPVFVLADGTKVSNGGTITIEADTVLALVLENPTIPPLPPTGSEAPWLIGLAGALLLGGGSWLLIAARRRRNGA